ncbi:MAG: flgJ [Panacagrimonas sp.]|nr:flagellar assembly peptidoglycan hydrolase FlgJ [Panacagrimonas sp.]MCC2658579.1 flgJ [Panacagrimonas sp.]
MALPAPTPAVTDLGALASLRASARANDPECVRKAAQQFEALFTQQLLKSARAANLGDDVLGGGQTEFYQDLFDQQMALHLSSGKGMGLAEVLVRQMVGGGNEAANGAVTGRDFTDYQPVSAIAREMSAARGARIDAAGAPSAAAAGDARTFVDQIKPHAERAARALGVPAEAIVAQAALETGWGRHVPRHADGRPSFNFFGIKADASWDGARLNKATHEHLGGRMQSVSADFRSYGSIGEAFDDYARFLQSNPRYADALREGADGEGFVRGLQDAGYATDPAYASKLLKLMGGATISRTGEGTRSESLG